MANKPYNGFTAQQRTKGGRWYRAMRARGRIVVADHCATCGSPTAVNGHSEDYSEPFGPHIGAFDLCWHCHMMIHCWRRAPERFAKYCETIEQGCYFPVTSRDFSQFAEDFLRRSPPVHRTLTADVDAIISLRDMAAGKYDPSRGGLARWAPEYKLIAWGQQDMFAEAQ